MKTLIRESLIDLFNSDSSTISEGRMIEHISKLNPELKKEEIKDLLMTHKLLKPSYFAHVEGMGDCGDFFDDIKYFSHEDIEESLDDEFENTRGCVYIGNNTYGHDHIDADLIPGEYVVVDGEYFLPIKCLYIEYNLSDFGKSEIGESSVYGLRKRGSSILNELEYIERQKSILESELSEVTNKLKEIEN